MNVSKYTLKQMSIYEKFKYWILERRVKKNLRKMEYYISQNKAIEYTMNKKILKNINKAYMYEELLIRSDTDLFEFQRKMSIKYA